MSTASTVDATSTVDLTNKVEPTGTAEPTDIVDKHRIRQLSFGELRMHLQHEKAAGTTQGALRVRLEGELDTDRLKDCVNQVKSKLQMLNVAIEKHDGDYYFVEPQLHTDTTYLACYTSPRKPTEWLSVMNQENETLLDSRQQLWRLAVYSYADSSIHDLILIMHHAVMDAAGSEYVLHLVLSLLSGEAQIDELLPEMIPVPIAMESDALSACDWDRFVEVQQGLKNDLSDLVLAKHQIKTAVDQRTTCTLPFELDEEKVAALDAYCSEHGVSLNSLLSVILAQAIHEETPDRDKFALYSATSLRPLCKNVPEQGLGCYLSVLPTLHEISPNSSLLEEAKLHKLELHKAFLDYARWVPKTYQTQAIEGMISQALEAEVFGNDYGITYAETGLKKQYGHLELDSQYVIARRSLGNVALMLHGLRSFGAIYFTLSYVIPIQKPEYAKKVRDRFLAIMEQLICGASLTANSFDVGYEENFEKKAVSA